MSASSPRVALASLAVVVALSSCSGEPAGPGATVESGPTTIQPAAASPPVGTNRVSCDVAASSADVRLVLDLPADFSERRAGPRGCSWGARVPMHDSDLEYSIDVKVSVQPVGEDDSLSDVYAEQQPFEVDGESPEGDDSILDLVLDEHVAALGPTIGDRLSWRCYCDGQDLITRMVQADGVRVTWSSVVELTEETDAAFDRAVAGAGSVRPRD